MRSWPSETWEGVNKRAVAPAGSPCRNPGILATLPTLAPSPPCWSCAHVNHRWQHKLKMWNLLDPNEPLWFCYWHKLIPEFYKERQNARKGGSKVQGTPQNWCNKELRGTPVLLGILYFMLKSWDFIYLYNSSELQYTCPLVTELYYVDTTQLSKIGVLFHLPSPWPLT